MGYFTDRNFGPAPRTATDIPVTVRRGILSLLRARANDGSFGLHYPEQCPDGRGPIGTDTHALAGALVAYRLFDFLNASRDRSATTPAIMDLMEFTYENVAKPCQSSFHEFYGHYHLSFDQEEGRNSFRGEINRIFERNGIAYELTNEGRVERIAPEGLREALNSAIFETGDAILDQLLEKSRFRFLDRSASVRRESLEGLWDAFERLKSIENGEDKKESIRILLDKASAEPRYRSLLESEMGELTRVGNEFMIRHTEIGRTPIETDEHVDYLFHRTFALVRLLLKMSGRGG